MEHALIYLAGYGLYFTVLVVLILAWDYLVTMVRRRNVPQYRWHREPSCQFIGEDVWFVAAAFFIFSVSASELTSLLMSLVM